MKSHIQHIIYIYITYSNSLTHMKAKYKKKIDEYVFDAENEDREF